MHSRWTVNRRDMWRSLYLTSVRLREGKRRMNWKIDYKGQKDRAEYLRHRGRLHGYAQESWISMSKQAEYLSRKLARICVKERAIKTHQDCMNMGPNLKGADSI